MHNMDFTVCQLIPDVAWYEVFITL